MRFKLELLAFETGYLAEGGRESEKGREADTYT